jgi:hypothetical protein
MVKIKDLTEKQLITQIEKYERIYSQLLSERQKRVDAGSSFESLMTRKEKKQALKNKDHETNTSLKREKTDTYHLTLDEEEISSLSPGKVKDSKNDDEEEHYEEVRVTQLLKLSKDQISEIQKKQDKKEKKKGLFGKKRKTN